MRHLTTKTGSYYYQSYLLRKIQESQGKNPSYSMRSFSRKLGVDVSILSKVISGNRLPSLTFNQKVFSQLKPTPIQLKKYEASIADAFGSTPWRHKTLSVKTAIRRKRNYIQETELRPEQISFLKNWYFFAILQLSETENFVSDSTWIADRLGLTHETTEEALSTLEELGLLDRKSLPWKRTHGRLTMGDPSQTGPHHKSRMKQIIEHSLHALDTVPIESRSHNSLTIAIDPDLIPTAKMLIDEFLDVLGKKLSSKKKSVYEIQISLFPSENKK